MAARTATRRTDPAPEPTPASAELRADLDKLDAARADDAERLAQLEVGRAAVLLTGDDAQAEAHEAATAKARRAIERADLMRPGFVEAIEAAEQREADEAKAERQAAARAEVEAVLGRLNAEYVEPAGRIAAFLADWNRVADLAREAGVDGPDDVARKRGPAVIRPAGRDERRVFVDDSGQEHDQPYPPGELYIDGAGNRYDAAGALVPPFREEPRFTDRPAVYDTGKALPALAETVSLPPARIEAPAPWDYAERYPVAPEPPRRAFRGLPSTYGLTPPRG